MFFRVKGSRRTKERLCAGHEGLPRAREPLLTTPRDRDKMRRVRAEAKGGEGGRLSEAMPEAGPKARPKPGRNDVGGGGKSTRFDEEQDDGQA